VSCSRRATASRPFALWSHKVLRWFVPHAMVVALISNIFLARDGTLYSLALLAQVAPTRWPRSACWG